MTFSKAQSIYVAYQRYRDRGWSHKDAIDRLMVERRYFADRAELWSLLADGIRTMMIAYDALEHGITEHLNSPGPIDPNLRERSTP